MQIIDTVYYNVYKHTLPNHCTHTHIYTLTHTHIYYVFVLIFINGY